MKPKAYLLGIGKAAPETSMTQAAAAEAACGLNAHASATPTIKEIFLNTRIESRGSVLLQNDKGSAPAQSFFHIAADENDYGPSTRQRLEYFERNAGPLAIRAAAAAVKNAGLTAKDMTHLITVTCTGFYAPGFDWEVVEALQLPPDIERLQIGFMGCHGAINGLRAARALAHENAAHRILLVSVELASLHYSYRLKVDQIISNALFADGAAACVIGGSGSGQSWGLEATASRFFAGTADHMRWQIGDHGFEMGLSSKVPKLIGENLRGWLEPWLAKSGLELSDVKTWAIHPGGPRVLEAVEAALDLPPAAAETSREILKRHGNMSSATLLYILDRFYASEAGLPCVALGFGPGLAGEAALFV